MVAAPEAAPIAIPNANQVQISPTGQNWYANQVLPSMNEEWSWVLSNNNTVRRIDNNGAVLSTFQVAETNASNIRMATRYDGSLMVFWYKSSSIWSRWYSESGTAIGAIRLVRTGPALADGGNADSVFRQIIGAILYSFGVRSGRRCLVNVNEV